MAVQSPVQVRLIPKPAGDDLRHQKSELRILRQPFHPLIDFGNNKGRLADTAAQHDQLCVQRKLDLEQSDKMCIRDSCGTI